jgi:hypothetical protein
MSEEGAAISQPFYSRGEQCLKEAIYLLHALSEIACGSSGGKACGRSAAWKYRVDTRLEGISEGQRRFSTATTISILIVL